MYGLKLRAHAPKFGEYWYWLKNSKGDPVKFNSEQEAGIFAFNYLQHGVPMYGNVQIVEVIDTPQTGD